MPILPTSIQEDLRKHLQDVPQAFLDRLGKSVRFKGITDDAPAFWNIIGMCS
jgi:hypothetical protein